MFEYLTGNNRSEVYARRFASVYRTLSTVYDPSGAIQDEPNIEEKVLQNARLAHALNFRWEAIAGRKWTVGAGEEATPEEQVVAKITMQGLANIRRFTTARKMLARADFSGQRFAEVRTADEWHNYGDGKMRRWKVPVVLKDIPKERFRWQRTAGTKTAVHLEIFSLDADAWVPVPEGAPIIRHTFDDSEETLGYGRGLREALYFVWYAVSHIHRERMEAIERFGQGRLVLKLAGQTDAQVGATNELIRNRALTTLAKMKARHEFVIGQGDELSQLEGSMTGHEMMSEAEKECYEAAEQLCLGSVLPTGGGGDTGSYARATVEQASSDSVFQTCGDMLEESISEGIVVPFVRDNYQNFRELGLDGVPHPKFTILRGGHGDPLKNAQRIQAAQAAGLKIKRSEAYDLCELTEPGEDDDVLEPAPQGGMGMPGMPGGDPGAGAPPMGEDEGGMPQAEDDAEEPQPEAGGTGVVQMSEFDESKHHRGQPGNPGQFGPGGGTATKGKAPTAGDAPAKPKKAPPGSQLHPDHLARLKALGVTKLPPAEATEIEVKADGEDVHDRAVAKWKDAKGRVQSAYTPEFHAKNAQEKWRRVEQWAPKRGHIVNDLHTRVRKGTPGSVEHAGALAALIIAKTGLRPGGAAGGEDDHFGVTTLKGSHVNVDGARVAFDYIGKSGKRNRAEVDDPTVASAVSAYKEKAGDGDLFPAGTLAAAREAIPSGMKLKDFRTIKATEAAQAWFASFEGPPPPVTGDAKKDGKAAAKALASASDVVAHMLNNTRAVAKSSYIHPQVFEAWAERVGLNRKVVSRAG